MSETTQQETPATTRTRPLTAREQRNLEKIVASDFNHAFRLLESQMQDWVEAEHKRLEDEYTVPMGVLHEIARKARALQESLIREAEEFLSEVSRDGFARDHNHDFVIKIPESFHRTGYKEALQRSKDDANKIMRMARDKFAEAENEAARKILLAGISTDHAVALLDGLPTPGAIMAQAIEAVRGDAPINEGEVNHA